MHTNINGESYEGALRVSAAAQPWSRSVDLYAGIVGPTMTYMAMPVSMIAQPPMAAVRPFMTVGLDVAQQLMDELWRCGLRPTEGTGSAGGLAATERHLADMRALVAHHVGAKL